MLSSWADLFRDGIIKREHAFHSFINCVSKGAAVSKDEVLGTQESVLCSGL